MGMMVSPYRRPPAPPRVGVLVDEGEALVEKLGRVDLRELADDVRVFASDELVDELLAAGHGEALTWNSQPIRWRPRRSIEEWRNRPDEALVFGLPFPERPVDALQGLTLWRDWLASHTAAPRGLGASGFSLLRGTLAKPLYTSVGDRPPIAWTIGGRQELGPAGAGVFQGRLEHWDLPAAYARTLGEMHYGGDWRRVDRRYPWEKLHARGAGVFVRARVAIPDLLFGPLPRRPRRQPTWDAAVLLNVLAPLGEQARTFAVTYPTSCRLQGTWTWDELRVALAAGAKLEKLFDIWVHVAVEQPFARWWAAVEEGRAMPHPFASLLAKATGNATWGQFAIRADGRKDVVSWTRERGRLRRRRRSIPVRSTRPGAPDLAELLTGQVRARLYRLMVAAGEWLLCAHTDGLWTRELDFRPDSWRLSDRARRLDLLGPQELRYFRPRERKPIYTVSGVPARLAPEVFDRHFAELEAA